MALSPLTGPILEEKIDLTDGQKEKLERYHFENIERLTNEWIEFRDQHITESRRDDLLSQSDLEVEALVKYCKNGGFAKYFVYINNQLHHLNQSINEAIRDPALRNIKWAEMTSSLLSSNWEQFVSFARLHEQDLRSVAGHIGNVGRSIKAVLEEIISMVIGRIKELFTDTLRVIRRYALPIGLVTCAAGVLGGVLPSTGDLLSGIFIGVLTTAAVAFAYLSFKDAKNESKLIERVGFRKARDTIQKLYETIEDKKIWEEDHGGVTRPYRDCERKIIKFRSEIEKRISST